MYFQDEVHAKLDQAMANAAMGYGPDFANVKESILVTMAGKLDTLCRSIVIAIDETRETAKAQRKIERRLARIEKRLKIFSPPAL